MRACVRACVRACMRACASARVGACVCNSHAQLMVYDLYHFLNPEISTLNATRCSGHVHILCTSYVYISFISYIYILCIYFIYILRCHTLQWPSTARCVCLQDLLSRKSLTSVVGGEGERGGRGGVEGGDVFVYICDMLHMYFSQREREGECL